MRIHANNPNKVHVSKHEVAQFAREWQGMPGPNRAYWWEFDLEGHTVDSDVPYEQETILTATLEDKAREFWRDRVETPVIFRTFKDGGDVIALFPELPGTRDPYSCLVYQHIGQHYCADVKAVIHGTRPAHPNAYQAMLEELMDMGYVLTIVNRATSSHYQQRLKELGQQ